MWNDLACCWTESQSREVLSNITNADLCNEKFRWLSAQTIEVARIEVRALRVYYVGELGRELHVPMNQLELLYNAIWSAGESFGVADFGVYAVNSLRMEKASRILPSTSRYSENVTLLKFFPNQFMTLRTNGQDPDA